MSLHIVFPTSSVNSTGIIIHFSSADFCEFVVAVCFFWDRVYFVAQVGFELTVILLPLLF